MDRTKKDVAEDLDIRIDNALDALEPISETRSPIVYELVGVHLNEARAHLEQAQRLCAEYLGRPWKPR